MSCFAIPQTLGALRPTGRVPLGAPVPRGSLVQVFAKQDTKEDFGE